MHIDYVVYIIIYGQTMAGGLDLSSQALLDKLNERLVGCIPKEVKNVHGVDYTVGLDELKKVYYALQMPVTNDPYLLSKLLSIPWQQS